VLSPDSISRIETMLQTPNARIRFSQILSGDFHVIADDREIRLSLAKPASIRPVRTRSRFCEIFCGRSNGNPGAATGFRERDYSLALTVRGVASSSDPQEGTGRNVRINSVINGHFTRRDAGSLRSTWPLDCACASPPAG